MSTNEKRGVGDLKLYKISLSLKAVSLFLAQNHATQFALDCTILKPQ